MSTSELVHNLNLVLWSPIGLHRKAICEASVQFSRSVVSNSLRPHESQYTRPPCPSPPPGVHSDSRPSSQWCHPAISSSVVPFSFCPQSLPASAFSNVKLTVCKILWVTHIILFHPQNLSLEEGTSNTLVSQVRKPRTGKVESFAWGHRPGRGKIWM